jgi:hypothetical protein
MIPAGAFLSGIVGQYGGIRVALSLVAAGLMTTTLWFVPSQISKLNAIPFVSQED